MKKVHLLITPLMFIFLVMCCQHQGNLLKIRALLPKSMVTMGQFIQKP